MAFTRIDCEQRSPEWRAARVGRLCSSDANEMMAVVKSGEAAGRRNARVKLVIERLTGKSQDSDFTSQDMQNGIDREAAALGLYQAQYGLMEQSGFIAHDELMAGWSPDAHSHDFTGFVEIKSPKQATHFETWKTRKVPTEYFRQMLHGGFWLAGCEWGDFVSYNPDFPENMRLVVVRLEAAKIEAAYKVSVPQYDEIVRGFLSEVDTELAFVKQSAGGIGAVA